MDNVEIRKRPQGKRDMWVFAGYGSLEARQRLYNILLEPGEMRQTVLQRGQADLHNHYYDEDLPPATA